ncbi:hypothetical protein AMJ52_05785 [candidate division TA06 bacterium DG_78]|uniref:non-specific protein-tyrosine kinase n=1 Tax=candidate division TA06 bacterium DG_78 TaxID=1703772 RepID=A0A0S7YDJ2_UNCT6|nr:MAG: hypothetical protein AMJ52_05785 [candidate division TA06 bacterium DG_78]
MNEINKNNQHIEEKPLNLRDIIYRVLRRREVFLGVALPFFIGVILFQFLKPFKPLYVATFDIGISREKQIEGFFSNYEASQMSAINQRVISSLLSVKLAEEVVDSLAFYADVGNGNSNIRIETKIMKDFEKPLGPFKIKFASEKFSVLSDDGEKICEGKLGEFIDLNVIQFKVSAMGKIPQGETYTVTFYPKDRMALALRNSLSIKVLEAVEIEKEPGYSGVPSSGEDASKKLLTAEERFAWMNRLNILRLRIYWGNPDDALRIARVFADKVVTDDVKEKSLQYVQSRDFVESQLLLYQDKLNEHAEKVREFKRINKIADVDVSTQAMITQTSDLELKKGQLEIEQKLLQDLNEYLTSKDNARIDTTLNLAANLLSDPILQNFYTQFLNTEAELRAKLNEYSPEHPKALETIAKLDGLRDQIKEQIRKRMSTIKTEIASVENQIRSLLAKLGNVSEDEIELARLERDRETAEKLYVFFAEKLEEIRVQEAGVTSDLKIINFPVVSATPVNSRNIPSTIFLAFIISVLLGGSSVFIAELFDHNIKDPEIIKERVRLPIFASIPIFGDEKKTKKTPTKEKPVEKKRILIADVTSNEFESFRKLSTNIDFSHPEKKDRAIYVTSPGPDEGKTFIALNFGLVLSMSDKKTVIIDTDFRKKKGTLTDDTKLKDDKGLFDVLSGEVFSKDAIVKFQPDTKVDTEKTPSTIVDLLPIGKIPPNPFLFLESEKMKKLVEELKNVYDNVIIDGVPILLFADATYLANFADGVLIVVKYGRTGYKELENSRDILLRSKANIIGVVMNFVPITMGSYYYHYYHKYYSKYYSKE